MNTQPIRTKSTSSRSQAAAPESAAVRSGSSKWLILSIVVLLAVSGYMGYQLFRINNTAQIQGQKELDQVVKKVGRLVVLPEGESPTLATVTDPEKLKDQAFFAHAQVGFKVLLFPVSQKAILYDPKADKIVEIAPITAGNANPDGSETQDNKADTTSGDTKQSQ